MPAPIKLTFVQQIPWGPTFLTHAPNDARKRLFVLSQNGQIMIIEQGKVLPTPFIDLVSSIEGDDGGEAGLLGMAFDPDYEVTGRFWVAYTAPPRSGTMGFFGQLVVESYRISTNPDVADPTTRSRVLAIDKPGSNHNGGMLAFGPDGCLFMSTGDGGGEGDMFTSSECPNGNGQCLDTELGKILRIDVEHPETAAPGNLVGGSPYIWDYGLRNPWRFSFDRATGDMYIGDVGESSWEELDIELRGTGHHNYGWRVAEGKHCLADSTTTMDACTDHGVDIDPREFTPPAYDYSHNSGAAVIGGYVYRGTRIPSLVGYYLFADFEQSRLWAIAWDGRDLCGPLIQLANLQDVMMVGSKSLVWPTSFGEDADGEIYMTSLTGGIWRIDPQ